MKIVIIGDGKVGYKLAKQLSVENYDVVMIDSNEKKLKYAVDRLDIACVTGDAADAEVQREADVPHADLVIACTSADECNMLSCLIARRLGARHTIARVRNPIYFKQIGLLKEDLHLSMAVNPELIVADEISRLLLFPDASKIETFVKGRVELIEYAIPEDSKLIGVTLANMYARFQIKLLVCAVERPSAYRSFPYRDGAVLPDVRKTPWKDPESHYLRRRKSILLSGDAALQAGHAGQDH